MLEVLIQAVHSQVILRCPSIKAAKVWGPQEATIFMVPPAGQNKRNFLTSCEFMKVGHDAFLA
jgi:hypothetical protein